MKLLNKTNEWLREYRPNWKLERIHGSGDRIKVIISENNKHEVISFKYVGSRFGVAITDIHESEYV